MLSEPLRVWSFMTAERKGVCTMRGCRGLWHAGTGRTAAAGRDAAGLPTGHTGSWDVVKRAGCCVLSEKRGTQTCCICLCCKKQERVNQKPNMGLLGDRGHGVKRERGT